MNRLLREFACPPARRAHALVLVLCAIAQSARTEPLDGTAPLTLECDLSAQMVEGIGRWLDREITKTSTTRLERWKARISPDSGAIRKSDAEAMRKLLRVRLGMTEQPVESRLEVLHPLAHWPASADRAAIDNKAAYRALLVRWNVFDDVWGDGILLQPSGKPKAVVIALPDASQDPESIAGLSPGVSEPLRFATSLVQQGCTVLVPRLIDRRTEHSGNDRLGRHTNQPHREWIYRPAFEMGRTLIGYEVQKVLCAIDALTARFGIDLPSQRIGVVGYGEGGMLALHAAALDPRIDGALISGFFSSHDRLWDEPIDRNVFAYQHDFGDAELAALARRVVVEHSLAPEFTSPPATGKNVSACAAPGAIKTPPVAVVETEIDRANQLRAEVSLVKSSDGKPLAPISEAALRMFLVALGFPETYELNREPPGDPAQWEQDDERMRQRRAIRQLERHTQHLWRISEQSRATALWSNLKPGLAFEKAQADLRRELWESVIGKITADFSPPNPRTRPVAGQPTWRGYEVVLDVLPDVFAWGWLLIPKDLKPGQRRPVVVCQHGLEGVPADVVTEDTKNPAWQYYKGFAAQLAARGFIVYAPHNPYRGRDAFRVLQRKANPLGLSLFSFIIAQHDVATRWLASLPFVDPQRIAFYGLSYGGKTAMRVPALLDRYCLSICSGDFNEWIGKNVNIEEALNYPFTGEYEMPEWNLGFTANYAEMAMLIAPRPFMVERGHEDGVGLDHWVGYEWAKVRRGYDQLGIADRAEIEWFDGPHTIHGVGSVQFLHKHLNWPGQ
jgi:dienelactone hydrolase